MVDGRHLRVAVDDLHLGLLEVKFLVFANVGETHVETVPVERAVQALQTHSEDTHHNHFVERTGEREVTLGENTVFGALLTSTDPILLVAHADAALNLRSVGNTTGDEERLLAVAAADKGVLRAVEDGDATAFAHQALASFPLLGELGQQTTVVPVNLHLRHIDLVEFLTGGIGQLNVLCVGSAIGEQRSGATLGTDRIEQVQRLEGYLHDVASHVAESACAIVPPATPVPRMVSTVVRTIFSRTQKEIPAFRTTKTPRNGHFLGGSVQALRPEGTVGSAVHAGDLADFAVPDPLTNEVAVFGRCTLVTHLRSHFVLLGQVGEQAGLVNGVCQRFLNIDVLTHGDGVGSHNGVGVVRSCHKDSIDALAHLVVHATEVTILLGFGMTVERVLCIVEVHVAEGNDVVGPLHVAQVSITHATDADAGNVQLVARSDVRMALAKHRVRNYGQADSGSRTTLKEFPS